MLTRYSIQEAASQRLERVDLLCILLRNQDREATAFHFLNHEVPVIAHLRRAKRQFCMPGHRAMPVVRLC